MITEHIHKITFTEDANGCHCKIYYSFCCPELVVTMYIPVPDRDQLKNDDGRINISDWMMEIDLILGLRGNLDWKLFKDTDTGELFHEAKGWHEKFEWQQCVKCHEHEECREIDHEWVCHECRDKLIDEGILR